MAKGKKPKAKPGTTKEKVKKGVGKPTLPMTATLADDKHLKKYKSPVSTEWVGDEECPICVRAAVSDWCGQNVYDFSITLRDLYAPRGACNNAALERLREILGLKCHRTPPLSVLSCTMTFAALRQLVCGL